MKKYCAPRSRRLQYEALESRELMAVTATLNVSGVLNVVSDNNADDIKFVQTNNVISITGVVGSWTTAQVNSIFVELNGGNDVVSVRSLTNGGNQALGETVTIRAGAGNERIVQTNGTNLYLSGAGNKLELAPNGSAKVNGYALNLTNQMTANLSGGVLTITCTNGNDKVLFYRTNNVIGIKNFATTWAASSVTSIVVHMQDGADLVSVDSLANGGNQTFGITTTVLSGMGTENVRLRNDNLVTFTGIGNVLKIAASGYTATLNGTPVSFTPPAPPQPPNWFDSNIADAALRSLGKTLYADNAINRSDIMALFTSAGDNGGVDATELSDLTKIVNNSTLFAGAYHVERLAEYIVLGSTANATYQGQALGNLVAGSTTAKLTNLVNKWFLGLDRPTATGTYRQFAGQLFVSGAAYTDINQGQVGDCYLLASLAEVALKNSSLITNMFVVNGDGTYTVKFFNNGAAEFVTVDSYLPTNASGYALYAGTGKLYTNAADELWTMLAEKAYVQANQFGWIRPGLTGNGQNAYSGIEGGYIYAALGHITGQATTPFASTATAQNFTVFVNAWNAGKMIGFASKQTPTSSSVVGSHAYTVIGYNASNQTITLYNPWGPGYATVTMTWAQIGQNFSYFDRTT